MSRQRELTDILNKWAYEYYVLDAPTVSDKEYDAFYDELKKLEAESGEVYPDSPTQQGRRRADQGVCPVQSHRPFIQPRQIGDV